MEQTMLENIFGIQSEEQHRQDETGNLALSLYQSWNLQQPARCRAARSIAKPNLLLVMVEDIGLNGRWSKQPSFLRGSLRLFLPLHHRRQ
jgi:hypothetical protein